jgi:uncharacterized membrane protein
MNMDDVNKKTFNLQQIIALGATILTAFQAALLLAGRSSVCINDGCRIVDELAKVSPLYFNLAGLLYFQLIFWSLRWFNRRPGRRFDWPAIFLLAGLVGESVLLSYQLVVAKVICSYCIIVFAFVVALNILHGRRQIVYGLAIIVASILSFNTLSFTSANVSSNSFSLDQGVYGIKTCTHPSKQLFLIFSFNHPQCINVLEALQNCTSCDLYLNPIDQVAAPPLVGIDQRESYNPEINRAILSIFGIDQVPVLLAKNLNGYTFISGEDQIINYVQQACYTEDPLMYLESSMPEKNKIDLFTETDDECSVEINCEEK